MLGIRNYKQPLLIFAYLYYILTLVKYNLGTSPVYFILGLLPLFGFFVIKYLNNRSFRSSYKAAAIPVVAFYLLYFLLVSFNTGLVYVNSLNFIIFFLHSCAIFLLLNNKSVSDTQPTVIGFLLISVIVVFIPHYRLTGTVALGSFYNLLDPSLLTTTTVEAPLCVALLLVLSLFDFFFKRNRNVINVVSILLSVFLLLVFSRRGFIFSSIVSLGIYYLYFKTKKKLVIYASFSLLFLPMFWNTISIFVVEIFNNEIVSTYITRSDTSELVSATGRAITWQNILDVYFDFDKSHFFGIYGGPPESLFISSDEDGRYLHAHNSFLQLFLEGGYLINIVFIYMISKFFKNFIRQNEVGVSHNFYLLVIIFLFSLSATETLMRGLQFSNLMFCYSLIAFNLAVEHTNNTARSIQTKISNSK